MVLTGKKKFSMRLPYRYDMIIHLCMLILAGFGLFMIPSASMGQANGNVIRIMITIVKQLAFVILGYFCMVMMARWFTFDRCRRNMKNIVLGLILLLALALCWEVDGARAWIKIPLPGLQITLQPSEFSKIVIIMIMAVFLGDVKNPNLSTEDLLRNPMVLIGTFIFIVIFFQKDFGTAVIMAGIACFCFLIPSHRSLRKVQKFLVWGLLLAVLLVGLMLLPQATGVIKNLPFFKEYQINRILAARNPFTDRYDSGFQLINGLISFARGGISGVGYGNSIQKYANFKAADTDFILAIVVEEMGLVGFMIIFLGYGLIIARLLMYAVKMKSEKGKIVLVGVAAHFFIHFAFNVGGVTGLIPLTGVPLLMISAGGSSTLAIMVSVGMAQAVISQYRQGKIR